MSTIGNIIWILLGGIWMSIGWVIAGVIMYVTVIGIPWGRSCFVIARFTLFPFGHEAVPRRVVTGQEDLGTGTAGLLGNIVWLGIPFGIQHFKLAGISLMPVGQTIVPKGIAARRR